MLKVLLIAESNSAVNALRHKLDHLYDVKIVAALVTAELSTDIPKKYVYDSILLSNSLLNNLLASQQTAKYPRQQIVSKTHQGIQVVAVENIMFFQAEHKYVTAFHNSGQLLIDDSLDSLEQEFSPIFIRIHRKLLVARQKIEQLYKDANGKYFIKLHNIETPFTVSRRKLAQVRKILSCI